MTKNENCCVLPSFRKCGWRFSICASYFETVQGLVIFCVLRIWTSMYFCFKLEAQTSVIGQLGVPLFNKIFRYKISLLILELGQLTLVHQNS